MNLNLVSVYCPSLLPVGKKRGKNRCARASLLELTLIPVVTELKKITCTRVKEISYLIVNENERKI